MNRCWRLRRWPESLPNQWPSEAGNGAGTGGFLRRSLGPMTPAEMQQREAAVAAAGRVRDHGAADRLVAEYQEAAGDVEWSGEPARLQRFRADYLAAEVHLAQGHLSRC